MGVSGCGKSTVAQRLAQRLDATYQDADDYHPEQNIRKMASGIALTDQDRQGWLQCLADLILASHQSQQSLVLACSALKQQYRDVLQSHGVSVQFVYLQGDFDTIATRLRQRQGHFMGESLLHSQFAALEEPEDALWVSIELPPAQMVTQIMTQLESATAEQTKVK